MPTLALPSMKMCSSGPLGTRIVRRRQDEPALPTDVLRRCTCMYICTSSDVIEPLFPSVAGVIHPQLRPQPIGGEYDDGRGRHR